MTLSYYAVSPDQSGAYDHEDRGYPGNDLDELWDDDRPCWTDPYIAELIEEHHDLTVLAAELEAEIAQLQQQGGAA